MKFSMGDLNTVSSIYVFWKNVYREGLAFLRGISEIKFTRVPTSFSATAIYRTLQPSLCLALNQGVAAAGHYYMFQKYHIIFVILPQNCYSWNILG